MKKYFWICSGLSIALFATALTVSLVNDNQAKKETKQDMDDMNHILEESKEETTQKLNALAKELKESRESLNSLLNQETNKLEDAITKLKSDFNQADENVLSTLRLQLNELESKLNEQDNENKNLLLSKINEFKTSLDEVTSTFNLTIDKLSKDLMEADKTNAKEILSLKTSFESFCNETEEKINHLNDELTTSINGINETVLNAKTELNNLIISLRNDLEELHLEHLNSIENLTTAIDNKINEIKAEISTNQSNINNLQVEVSGLSTSLNTLNAALSTDVSDLRQKLIELTEKVLNSNLDGDIENINTWIDNFASEAFINAKAVKVGEFYDFCHNVKIELKDTLLSELYDSEQASIKYNEVETIIDKAYQQGVVKISLSDSVENLNLTIEDVKKSVDDIVEEFRVAVYKNTINTSFNKYREDTLEKVNSMNLSEEEYALLQKDIEAINLKEYSQLQSSEEVKEVLLDAMFDIYKEYIKAWLIVTQNQGVQNMDSLKHLTDEERASYIEAIKKIKFTDNYPIISRQHNQIDDNVLNVETNDAISQEQDTIIKNIEALCQLAINQNEENYARTIYFEKWFYDEENGYLKYLSQEDTQNAQNTYLNIVEKYDYSINNIMNKDELLAYYQKEVEELSSSMYNFEYAWKLSDKQVNANKEFEEYKLLVKENIQKNYMNLTNDEVEGYNKMIDIVVLPDVSEFNTLEDIDVIEKEKRTLINNIYLLAMCQNEEYSFISNSYLIYDSSRYVNEFSVEEIQLAKNEITKLDKKYSYSIENINELDNETLLNIIESYTTSEIEESYQLEQSNLQILIDKFDIVLTTREKTQLKIDDINDKGVIFGEAVANDFGLEIRLIGEFAINDINATLKEFESESLQYYNAIDNVYTKANELHKALTNTHSIIKEISSYQTENGLTETEINQYIQRIYKEGYAPDSKGDLNSEELYNKISVEGVDITVVLNTYTKKVNDIGIEAKVLFDARTLSYQIENENLVAMNSTIEKFNKIYNDANNLTVFNSAQWELLTNEIQNILKSHSTVNCKTPQEVTKLDEQFDQKLIEWQNKVDAQYKILDQEMLNTTITQTIDELEAYILELRKIDANKSKDIEILQLRKEYKELIRQCEYSFEVEQKYNELKLKLSEVLDS